MTNLLLRPSFARACALLLSSSVAALSTSPTHAQEAADTATFDIPAQSLDAALRAFMRQSGLQVTYASPVVDGKRSSAVAGPLPATEALSRLLAGTQLRFRFVTDATVTIEPGSPVASDGAVSLGPVRVGGGGAPTGARAIVTEDTQSYGTRQSSIGRMGETLRETPQSVTVITREQLDERNLNNVYDAVAVATGAVVVQNDDVNQRSEIYFRGFLVDSVRVDGAAVSGNNDVTMFDSAIYDRIEVMRGPSGPFQGAGLAGGTLNLVRKRAPDQLRGVADIGAPLDAGGAVRGRVVAVAERSDSYVDYTDTRHFTLFGTLDLDLGPATTLTLGSSWQDGRGRNGRGLPAYDDGTLLDVRRSTYIGADWNLSTTRSNDAFANLEHRFDGGALLTATASYLDRKRDGLLAYPDAAVDPVTGDTELLPEHRIDSEASYNLDAHLLVPFDVAGLEQKLLVGADYRWARERRDQARGDSLTQNVFDPDPAIPRQDLVFDEFTAVRTQQFGLYGQLRLKPLAWATLVGGGRLTWWNSRAWDRATGEVQATLSENGEFTPYLAAIAELGPNLSAYVSYASIFVPQEDLAVGNIPLRPRTGAQYEVGIKGAWLEGLLNGQLALFQIEDRNRAVRDPADPEFSVAAGRVRSRGFEAELTGELAAGWQIQGGYTYVEARFRDDPENAGLPFDPRTPRHSVRLWSSYKVQSGGLAGLSFAGGLKLFSSIYNTEGNGVRFGQPAYETVDAQVGYDLGGGKRLLGTVTNLFDRHYYQSVGYEERQNYYGRPRAVALKFLAAW
jgi:outer-membrane receptor for ferric coprogen and ferric-rhodotorulic acid